jgi:DNA-binding IclR family transcriptional regulator
MVKTADRTLEVFELFAQERQPLSLSDIARLLQIPISSCHDLVRTLQARGYLYELGPRAGYYPTLRIRDIGRDIAESDPVVARAALLLGSMRDALNESVFLAKAHGLQANYLLALGGKQTLRVMRQAGDSLGPLYCKSGGRALLASLDDKLIDEYLKSTKLEAFTEHTKISKNDIKREIELGRARGWFLNEGESEGDLITLSASFRWSASLYIVTIAAPSSRFKLKLEEATSMLTNVCKLLERGGDPTQIARDGNS